MAKTTKKKTTKKKSKSTVNKAGNYTKPEMRKRIFNRQNKRQIGVIMNISKKYIREAFRDSGIQLTSEALAIIEEKLKKSFDGFKF